MSSITAGDAALFAPGALARILPACVAVATTERDVGGPPHYAEEAEALGNAVEKRRCEFVTGRACARAALAQLGVPAQPIPVGRRGEPLW
ncbi:MAG: 4-phosphopantetheinyl transferase, partial [Thermoleophilia bacterium]